MQLINTDIVKPHTDIFWQQPASISGLAPGPVLAITAAFANQPEYDQLTGILKAGCKLGEQHYNVVQMAAGEQIAWYRIRQALQPKVVLLFNIFPIQLGISALFRLNEVNKFDGVLFIPSVPLGLLITDKTAKGQLWNNALKPVFEGQAYGNLIG